MNHKHIKIGSGNVVIGNDLPFVLIAGPCQLQSRDLAMKIAEDLVNLTTKLGIPYVFKSSFDKANRNSVSGSRGIGIDAGLKIFEEIRNTFKCPIITDIHTEDQAGIVSKYVDIIQQPAFLIRQTDLTSAIAKTGCVVNLKKGQFQAPSDMKNIIEKCVANGNENVCLTERGTSFGYGDLIVDVRSFPVMAETGYPVIIDCTHSVQKPAAMGGSSGGDGKYAPLIARSALSTGLVGGVFIETHPQPLTAGSDIYNHIPLMYMEEVLTQLKSIDEVAKANVLRLDDWNQEGCEL